jgi:two-component system, sensor histidine kinase and response regulator
MKNHAKEPRSEFFAVLSHQVRQPLNALIEELSGLGEEKLSPSKRNIAQLVQQEAQELANLVNDVLDLTRLQDGNFHLGDEPLDLHELLESLKGVLTGLFQRKGASFDFLIHPDTPALVMGDPGRLRQALTCLVLAWPGDAWTGQVVLEAGPEAETNTEVRLRFVFRAPADAATAARLLALVEHATDDRKVGRLLAEDRTGQNLRAVLAARLAGAMGGEVGVEYDGKEQVAVTLLASFGRNVSVSHRDFGDPAALDGLSVMLIDDQEESARELTAWLTDWGCAVGQVRDTADGLTQLRQAKEKGEPFGFVLIVNRSLGQEAEDFGRAVKNDRALSNTAVGLITGVGRRGDVPRLREIGFRLYLTQPVARGQLRDAMSLVGEERFAVAAEASGVITRHYLRERELRQLRVGVLEKNAVHRMIVLLLLDKLGCAGREVTDETLNEQPLDDVVLVTAEGRGELLDRVRKQYSPVRLIAMAEGGDFDAADFHDAIRKPVTMPLLRAALGRFLVSRDEQRERGEAPAENAAPALLDVTKLLANFDNDREVVQEIVTLFVDDFGGNLAELKNAMGQGDAAGVTALAETMKDVAGSLEVGRLRDCLADVERLARAARLADAQPLVGKAERLFAQIEKNLADL